MKFLMILLTVLALTSCAHHGKKCASDSKCKDSKQCELKKKDCKDKKNCIVKKGTKADHKAADCTSGQCKLHK